MKMKGGPPLTNLLDQHRVTFSQMTPTLFKNLAKCPSNLEQLVLGGESFPSGNNLKSTFSECKKMPKLFNIYGLTEMSVWQSLTEIKDLTLDEQPIYDGQNLLNDTSLYLDHDGQICLETSNRACYYDNQSVRLAMSFLATNHKSVSRQSDKGSCHYVSYWVSVTKRYHLLLKSKSVFP